MFNSGIIHDKIFFMNKRILFALLLMGFTSLVVQTLLIREFLISFYGNELTIGLILSNWIILEPLEWYIFLIPRILANFAVSSIYS